MGAQRLGAAADLNPPSTHPLLQARPPTVSLSPLPSPLTPHPPPPPPPAVPAETYPGEKRVALTPAGVKALKDAGFGRVLVQAGAGAGSAAPDAEYAAAGGEIAPDAAAALGPADVVVKVRPPTDGEVGLLKPGSTLVSYVQPAINKALVAGLAGKGMTVLALDCIPRTLSRAQAFDTLSSQANVAGHRAAIEAAHAFGRLIPSQSTAAGRVPPASALVIGGGVAGLAAAGAARGLGAKVAIFDTRAAVEEQAKSMGCEFVGGPSIMQGEAGEGGAGTRPPRRTRSWPGSAPCSPRWPPAWTSSSPPRSSRASARPSW